MLTVVHLRPPIAEKPTVNPGRGPNTDYRKREYLTEAEIEKLLAAAGQSRNPTRDRLLVLLAYRHALQVSELVGIQVSLVAECLQVLGADLNCSEPGSGRPSRASRLEQE
jgi:integrase